MASGKEGKRKLIEFLVSLLSRLDKKLDFGKMGQGLVGFAYLEQIFSLVLQ